MTTNLGWSRCRTCGGLVNIDDGPDCPRCGTPPLQPIEIVREHPGPELAAAEIEIRNLEGRIQRVEEVAAEQMLEAQRVILQQQTEIADLGTQLTHALAETPDQPTEEPSASTEGAGL